MPEYVPPGPIVRCKRHGTVSPQYCAACRRATMTRRYWRALLEWGNTSPRFLILSLAAIVFLAFALGWLWGVMRM